MVYVKKLTKILIIVSVIIGVMLSFMLLMPHSFFSEVGGNKNGCSRNLLLERPAVPKPEEILASFQTRAGNYGPAHRYFFYKHGAVALYVLYEALPASFTDEERALFTPVKRGKKTVFYYSFGDVIPKELPDVEVSKRTIVEKEGEPQPISVKDLAQMMRSKRVVFFTGAGISASAGIHTMKTLYDDLGLNPSVEIDDFVRNAMHHPEVLVQKVLAFYRSTKMSPPTPAHLSLAHLSIEKQSQILTGNFDLLHERSGVIPYRVFYRDMENDLSPESLKEVDVILCVGMSQDIKGVLKMYKEANPNGILVSTNKETPDFLGQNDYFLRGDAQELLPVVEKEFDSLTDVNP